MRRSAAVAVAMAVALVASPASAIDDQTAGDVVSTLIAGAAVAQTYNKDDPEGRTQLVWNVGTELVVNTLLRGAFNEHEWGERPNGHEYGFPSGHVGFVWSFAAFLSRRYGLEYGIPAYAASIYVGHTRYTTDHHYVRDMVAAAAVSQLIATFAVTNKYTEGGIKPLISSGFLGIEVEMPWDKPD